MPEPQTKPLIGRPTLYTKELGERICAQLATGDSLRTVTKEEGMPSLQTIFTWFRKYPEFLEQYARAKEEAADAMTEEILDIADNGINDWMEKVDPKTEKTIGWQLNGEHVQRSKLRVETRKWIASKLKPKKYGDKIDLTTNGKDLPIPILGGISNVRSDDSTQETS